MNAVVLTGRVLSGMSEQETWAKAAALFKLDAGGFLNRILARCPVVIRETSDAQEAHRLRLRLFECGAECEITETDGSKWQLEREGKVRGPVPLSFLAVERAARRLPDDTRVKRTSDTTWTSLESAVAGDTPTSLSLRHLVESEPHDPPAGNKPVSDAGAPPPLPSSYTNMSVSGAPVAGPAATPVVNAVTGVKRFDSPDNWWMHWTVPTGALLVVMIFLYTTNNLNIWNWTLIGLSAFWVYFDATHYKIGYVTGAAYRENHSAGGWALLTLFLWIIVFPYYLAKRKVLIAAGQQQPIEASGRTPKLAALAVLAIVPSILFFNNGTLPACDSDEAKSTLKEIYTKQGINIISMRLVGESSYDRGREIRSCVATLKSNVDEDVVDYTISWGDKSKDIYYIKTGR